VRVIETFVSIQGESTLAGRPCAFIRTAGCNLRCTYCDTAYSFEGGVERTVDDLAAWARETGVGLVEITGGEPLLQAEVPELAARLIDIGVDVMIETNGTCSLKEIPDSVVKVVDIKTPGSGHGAPPDPENLARLGPRDNIKFVLTSRGDYDWARTQLNAFRLPEICEVLFSPAEGRLSPGDLASWILEDRLPVRFQLQLHRIIWPDRDRGV